MHTTTIFRKDINLDIIFGKGDFFRFLRVGRNDNGGNMGMTRWMKAFVCMAICFYKKKWLSHFLFSFIFLQRSSHFFIAFVAPIVRNCVQKM